MLIENIKTITLIAFMAGWILVISELSMMANSMEVENFYSQRLEYAAPDQQKVMRSMQVQQWATAHFYKGNILTQTWTDSPKDPNTTRVGSDADTLQTKRSFPMPALLSFFLSSLKDDCNPTNDAEDVFTLCVKQGAIQ